MKQLSIPVAFTTYKVEIVQSLDDEGDDGECDFDNRVIRVKRKPHKDALRASIIHEACHAFCHEMGYDQLCYDEAFIESLALFFMRILTEWDY